jgi:hypothetical protein
MHEQITLTTPALLFSAISLILLAYTNRFLGYATLIRGLHEIVMVVYSPTGNENCINHDLLHLTSKNQIIFR